MLLTRGRKLSLTVKHRLGSAEFSIIRDSLLLLKSSVIFSLDFLNSFSLISAKEIISSFLLVYYFSSS